MKIKSKNTGYLHDVSKKDWEAMRKRGENRNYQIIDDTDDTTEPIEVKVEPIVLAELDDDLAEYNDEQFGDNTDKLEKEFYQVALDEAGIEYHHAEGIKKLKQKYEAI